MSKVIGIILTIGFTAGMVVMLTGGMDFGSYGQEFFTTFQGE